VGAWIKSRVSAGNKEFPFLGFLGRREHMVRTEGGEGQVPQENKLLVTPKVSGFPTLVGMRGFVKTNTWSHSRVSDLGV
jgi:hypothetical protein